MNEKWINRIRILCIFIFSLVFFVSAGILLVHFVMGAKEESDFQKLAQQVTFSPESGATAVDTPTVSKPNYTPLIEKNKDFAAWLSLDGTKLDYPVMFTPNDPHYYLRRNFDKQYSLSGTPFIDGASNLNSANILLHGHNMKNGSMFAPIMDYQKESFWQEHPSLEFNTKDEFGEYEIVSAFFTKIYPEDAQNVFRYEEYSGINDEKSYEEYVQAVRSLSLYNTGVDPDFGTQLITLSTCDNVTQEGRFVVVAAKKAPPAQKEAKAA